jgi:hypothetical protein
MLNLFISLIGSLKNKLFKKLLVFKIIADNYNLQFFGIFFIFVPIIVRLIIAFFFFLFFFFIQIIIFFRRIYDLFLNFKLLKQFLICYPFLNVVLQHALYSFLCLFTYLAIPLMKFHLLILNLKL